MTEGEGWGRGEAVYADFRLVRPKRAAVVPAGAGVGRDGDGEPRRAGRPFGQPPQGPVIRPEIMSHLWDTVGLIDGDQRKRQIMQTIDQMRLCQSLR